MLQTKNIKNTPLKEWESLQELSKSGSSWKEIVNTYVTTNPEIEDTEAAYQAFFEKFYEKYLPRIINDGGIFEAATRGYDVYIKNWLDELSADECKQLLSQRTDLDETALHIACDDNRVNVVKVLLEKGADPKVINDAKQTPLHIAAYNDSDQIIKLLLKHNASIDAVQMGDKPIHIAAMRGSSKAIRTLVDYNVDQLTTTGREGRTPIFVAALNNQLKAMQTLLELAPASVNQLNLHIGLGLLHLAAHRDNPEMIALLLKNKANIDLPSPMGFTPLQRALRQRNIAYGAAQLLIEHGAEINTAQPSPLYSLAKYGDQSNPKIVELAKLLIAKHATDIEMTYSFLKDLHDDNKLKTNETYLFKYLQEIHPGIIRLDLR